MMHTARHPPRHWLPAALALAALAGCASLAQQAPEGGTAIAGRWQLDVAHSDSFDARLDQWLAIHRHKMREQRRRYGGEGAEGGGDPPAGTMTGRNDDRNPPPLFMSPEEPARERQRMVDDLRPPAELVIEVAGSSVGMANDTEPMRRLVPGDRLTRIDSGGTAELACGWEGPAFVVRSRYTHKAVRTWRYERDRATGLLRVDFSDIDPEYGKLELQLRYRPLSPAG